MHEHISVAHNLKRSSGTKSNLVLFESYRIDFFVLRKPLLFTYFICSLSFEVIKGILTHVTIVYTHQSKQQ